MSICVAKKCSTRQTNRGYRSYHNFPINAEIRKIWVDTAKITVEAIKENSKLCSEHFTEDCFDRSDRMAVKLKDQAVPTIFKNSVKDCESDTDSADDIIEMEIKTEPLDEHIEEVVASTIEISNVNIKKNDKKPKLAFTNSNPTQATHIIAKTPREIRENSMSMPPMRISTEPIEKVDSLYGHELQRLTAELELLQEKHLEATKKIKQALTQTRRGRIKYAKNKQAIEALKKHNLELSQKLGILPFISPLSNDLYKRMLAKQLGTVPEVHFAPETRDFFVNLYSVSSLAFRYVREVFNYAIPGDRSLAHWRKIYENHERAVAVASISNGLPVDTNTDVFHVVEQYIGSLSSEVKTLLTENGFNQLVTLLAIDDTQIKTILENSSDLSDVHVATLQQLPKLMRIVSKKVSTPLTSSAHQPPAKTQTALHRTPFENERDRSLIVMKAMVCSWLNANTGTGKKYTKFDVYAQTEDTPFPFSGKIRCVDCLQDIRVTMQKNNQAESDIRWCIGMFIKHYKKFHHTKSPVECGEIQIATTSSALPNGKQKNQKRKAIKMEAKQDEDVPPKQIRFEPEEIIEMNEEVIGVEYLDDTEGIFDGDHDYTKIL